MSTVLALTSSALGADSVSSRLVREVVDRLVAEDTRTTVVSRDLDADPLPHLTADTVAALRGGLVDTARRRDALALSDALIAELAAADTLVIGAPMYNFAIPSTLKAWFDHVLRAGVTFRYTAEGPVGLLPGKRAVVVMTRGGRYGEDARAMDSQEPHLRTMLGFIGIDEVAFLRVEGLGLGPEERARSIDAALAEIATCGEAFRAAA